MKRPWVVWLYSFFTLIGIVIALISSTAILTNPYGAMGVPPGVYISSILELVLLIPLATFLYLFFMLKRNSLILVYIIFGLGVILSFLAQQWFNAGILAIFGFALHDYIKNKTIEGQKVFN
jgi:hypothetical protein